MPGKMSCPFANACLRASINLPRKALERAFTGKRKFSRVVDPSAGVKGQHATGDEAMQVDMVQQRLVPGV